MTGQITSTNYTLQLAALGIADGYVFKGIDEFDNTGNSVSSS